MSMELYIRGFCKAAEAAGVDPVALAKYAQEFKTDGRVSIKSASSGEYVNFLREFVSKDEVDDNLAREYGKILHKNNELFESAYEHYNPQHHHINWLWRPKTGPVQKLIYAFKKIEDKLPEDKKDGFRRVAERLVNNLNKKTSPFPIFPSYTYTPDEGGASQYGFMVF